MVSGLRSLRDDKDDGEMKMGGKALGKALGVGSFRKPCGIKNGEIKRKLLSFRRNRSKWGLAMVSGLRSTIPAGMTKNEGYGEMKMKMGKGIESSLKN